MNRRNTIQKDLVRRAVYELKSHVTADEVTESTVLRIFPRLAVCQ